MDTRARVILVLLLIAYSGFRLVRYLRYGLARRATAVPPSSAGILPIVPGQPGVSSALGSGHTPD
jgi:hypothetical protein